METFWDDPEPKGMSRNWDCLPMGPLAESWTSAGTGYFFPREKFMFWAWDWQGFLDHSLTCPFWSSLLHRLKGFRPPVKPVWILSILEGPRQQWGAFRSFSDMVNLINLILTFIPEYLLTLFVGLLSLYTGPICCRISSFKRNQKAISNRHQKPRIVSVW